MLPPRPGLLNFLAEHLFLLRDRARLAPYARAIRKVIRPGETVIDLGAGTGILAMLAARTGAARVLAIERGPIIAAGRRLTRRDGRVRWIHGRSMRVRLPDRADVLVTETLGHLGVEEGILGAVADARTRLIKRGARVIPRSLSIVGAAVTLPLSMRDWIEWRRPVEGLSFAALKALAIHATWVLPRWPRTLLSASRPLFTFRLDRLESDPLPVEGSVRLRLRRSGILHGVRVGFRAELAPGIVLDSSRTRSWRPVFFPIERPVRARKGEVLRFTLRIERDYRCSWRAEGAGAGSAHSELFHHPALRARSR